MVALAFRTTNFSAVRHDVHVSAPIETPGQRIDRFSLVLLATPPAAENLSPKPKCTLQHLHPSLGRHISRTKTSATLPCYQVSVALQEAVAYTVANAHVHGIYSTPAQVALLRGPFQNIRL